MVNNFKEKIVSRADIGKIMEKLREGGKKVVTTNGCFDILHAGHVEYLETARGFGDMLIVCLNTDDSVKRFKGKERPINTERNRAIVLAGLQSVDFVVSFDEDDPRAILSEIKPDIHVKGGDYEADKLPETKVVQEGGGEVRIVPLVRGFSTTALIEKCRS